MEKFVSEALLTATIAGILAMVLLPLAFILRWKSPHMPLRGISERWPGWLVLLSIILVLFVLPNMLIQLGIQIGCFRFLDFSADPQAALRPTVQVNYQDEWNSISASLLQYYASLAAMPVVLLGIWCILNRTDLVTVCRTRLNPDWKFIVSEVILCWAVYGLLAISVNIGLQLAYLQCGWTPKVHPIANVGIHDGTGGWIIGLGACVVAPLFEELIFRRWLMPWSMRRRIRSLWLQLFTLFFCMNAYIQLQRLEVFFFGLLLLLVQVLLFVFPQRTKQLNRLLCSTTFASNWSTSSLFAMLHATVWPSPVALMILSMGLGFLVVRTGRWWTAALCHALFNFTSLMVLYASQGAFGSQLKIIAP